MRLLAVETATGNCTVALWNDGAISKRKSTGTPHQQAEHLLPLIGDILNEQSFTYHDLNALAVCVGPGSFTGVRIGLAALQGIALATGKPLMGISSLEAICWQAYQNSGNRDIVATLDAGRGEYYTQRFAMENMPRPLTEATLVAYDVLAEQMKDTTFTVTTTLTPEASAIAELAALYLNAGRAGEKPAQPLYIRPPDAKKPASCI